MGCCGEALVEEAEDGGVKAVAETGEREEVGCPEVGEDGVEDLGNIYESERSSRGGKLCTSLGRLRSVGDFDAIENTIYESDEGCPVLIQTGSDKDDWSRDAVITFASTRPSRLFLHRFNTAAGTS